MQYACILLTYLRVCSVIPLSRKFYSFIDLNRSRVESLNFKQFSYEAGKNQIYLSVRNNFDDFNFIEFLEEDIRIHSSIQIS